MTQNLKNLSLAEKKALLLKKMKEAKAKANAERIVPLSPTQHRLWFFDRVQGANATYNLKFAFRLRGPLDLSLMHRAMEKVVARHESLRTRIDLADNQVAQIIAPRAMHQLPCIDLEAVAMDQREDVARQLIDREAARPFNLEKGPLLRTTIVRLEKDDHIFLTAIHHIVSDGWSMGVFVRDVIAYYDHMLTGKRLSLQPLKVQYRHFCEEQRSPEFQTELERERDYWQDQLAGAPPRITLPTDKPRPVVQTMNGNKHFFHVPASITTALSDVSRQQRATLYMSLLSAYSVLLSRYSGQNDTLIGSPHANRLDRSYYDLIGYFISTLVLRMRTHENPNFNQLIAQARKVASGAFSNARMPFERLVSELEIERRTDHQALFQVVFVLQNSAEETFSLPLVDIERLQMESPTAKFELQLSLTPENDGLRGFLEYNTDLFHERTIVNLARHFVTLLEHLTKNPERPIAALPLLSGEERHEVLHAWNDTARPVPGSRLMHRAFEEQAASHGERLAVLFEHQQLTYTEVNEQANRVAHLLRHQGIKQGHLVAVFMDRSAEMVPALLGILKSGAAYVPIETHLPEARITQLLQNLKAQSVMTQSHHLAFFEQNQEKHPDLQHLITLDGQGQQVARLHHHGLDQLAAHPTENPSWEVDPGDLSYIIFTSGSTGQPKGVILTHEPVTNLIEWVNRTYSVNEQDRVLFITALSFDLSVYDIFGLLSVGGSIRVASEEDKRDPFRLLQMLHSEPITFWDSAPAALQQVAPFVKPNQPGNHNLRLVFLSGDWIPLKLPGTMREGFPNANVVALGGATEATIWSNFYSANELDPEWVSIPYGNPIQNAAYYTLNQGLEPTPKRVAGDLFIGGDVLFTGYLNSPALTAWKLIPDPFSKTPGARLYRTGDRARWWYQGYLEFLGRVDNQVKIRGFRVECGESQALIIERPEVATAVVRPRDLTPGDKRLVAYVVPQEVESLDVQAIRDDLLEKLPSYMVPTIYIPLEQLPVTSNGKLDTRILEQVPLPSDDEGSEAENFRSAETPLQEELAEIWARVLKRKQVGIDENFFENGGDSILAIQIVSAAREAGHDLQPRDLFQNQTIEELERLIQSRAPLVKQAVTEKVTGDLGKLPIHQWFFGQKQPVPEHFNQHLLLEIPAAIQTTLLQATMDRLATHHDALRLRFDFAEDGHVRGTFSEDIRMPVEEVDLSHLGQEEAKEACREIFEQAQASLDPSGGPVGRVKRIHLNGDTHYLLWIIHHLVIDGVSWRVLGEDFQTIYTALELGSEPELPARTHSMQDWSEALATYAESDEVLAQMDYWREQLDHPSLPQVGRPIGQRPLGEAVVLKRGLGSNLSDKLKSFVQESNASIEASLLSALVRTFARYTDENRVGLWLERHGREAIRSDISLLRTVGWFTSIFPQTFSNGYGQDMRQLLGSVQEQLDRLPHGGLGYGALRYLNSEKGAELAGFNQPEILFNYLGDLSLGESDSAFKRLDMDAGSSRSDQHQLQFQLEINCHLQDDDLIMTWTAHRDSFAQAVLEGLMDTFAEALHNLTDNPQSQDEDDFDLEEMFDAWD